MAQHDGTLVKENHPGRGVARSWHPADDQSGYTSTWSQHINQISSLSRYGNNFINYFRPDQRSLSDFEFISIRYRNFILVSPRSNVIVQSKRHDFLVSPWSKVVIRFQVYLDKVQKFYFGFAQIKCHYTIKKLYLLSFPNTKENYPFQKIFYFQNLQIS